MIVIDKISKKFIHKKRAFLALNQVSLTVEKGEILGIIGSSGAGKSTLIRCMNLLERPDEGTIIMNGVQLNELSPKKLALQRKKIGMIFQHFNLMSGRTVFDNIAFPLELDGASKTFITSRVNELLSLVGLEEKALEYPKNLSGGQKQRVAIARALANEPHILLCDEATSALDPSTTQNILQLLRNINKRLSITIVLITHEMDVVKSICHRVAVMSKGRIIAKGTLEELVQSDENAVTSFINTEAITIPQALFLKLREEEKEEYNDYLLEIHLKGMVSFDEITKKIFELNLNYQLIKADVDYIGVSNFGKLLIQISGNTNDKKTFMEQLKKDTIGLKIRGYV